MIDVRNIIPQIIASRIDLLHHPNTSTICLDDYKLLNIDAKSSIIPKHGR